MDSIKHRLTTILFVNLLALIAVAAAVRPAQAIDTIAREAILVDMETGAVLMEKNADERMPPASMSKLMTLYMLMERVKEGSLSLDETLPVSENAWRRGGYKSGSSTMFLEPGKRVRVEDLLRGIIIQSGNDACIVAAEALAGSEQAFAEQMTERAKRLGLKNSSFANATGWPNPDHWMTARDLAMLATHMIKDFPSFFHIFGERDFTYNGIHQFNRNPLLGRGIGVDGLKTGHTEEAGFGLTATAKRGDRRLVLVVNGLPSEKARLTEPQRLLEWGFREFKNYRLFKPGEVVARAKVWLGKAAEVPLVIKDGLYLTLPRKARAGMKVAVSYNAPVPAPIMAGQTLASLKLTMPGRDPVTIPLVAGASVPRLGFFGRTVSAVRYILLGESH